MNRLAKKLGGRNVLRNLDLMVKKGETYGILGHSEAGTSILLRIMAGFCKPDEGSCIVCGWDVSKIAHPGDLHVGYVSDAARFYPWLTGKEMLTYLGNSRRGRKGPGHVESLLAWAGLLNVAQAKIGQYDLLALQRLRLAASLVHDPELLLLDDPILSLGPDGKGEILTLIADVKHTGKTIVFATHAPEDLRELCDRCSLLKNGALEGGG